MSDESYAEQHKNSTVIKTLMNISHPYIILISIIGICGNILTIIMLSRRSLSKNFNNGTLIALAITDLMFNFTLVAHLINDFIKANNENFCVLLSFFSHLAELLSACFTVQFTAQRFIAVRFPLSVFIEKKIHLHYFIVAACVILGCTFCLLLVINNSYDKCHEDFTLNWFIFDALLSFVIPITSISILNILIIIHLKTNFQYNHRFCFVKNNENLQAIPLNSKKKLSLSTSRIIMYTPKQSRTDENVHRNSFQNYSSSFHRPIDGRTIRARSRSADFSTRHSFSWGSKSQSYRVTRMLILVSTCFLVLNAPGHICTIGLKICTLTQTLPNEMLAMGNAYIIQYNQTWPNHVQYIENNRSSNMNEMPSTDEWMKSFYIIVIITQHISYASYSINFFLYSLCGMKFRGELKRFIFKPCLQ